MFTSILTVTAAPTHTNLTTPDVVAADLQIDAEGDNTQLYADIGSVSQSVSGFIGRDLGKATLSELFRVTARCEALRLTRFPIVEITSVTENGEVLDAEDFEVDGKRRVYRLSSDCRTCWPRGKIVIVYKAGYLLPEDNGYEAGQVGALPADVEKAAVIACRALYQARGRDPMVKSETVPGVIEQELWVGSDPGQGESGLPKESERLLNRYVADEFV
jgi:hypothetical protein